MFPMGAWHHVEAKPLHVACHCRQHWSIKSTHPSLQQDLHLILDVSVATHTHWSNAGAIGMGMGAVLATILDSGRAWRGANLTLAYHFREACC